MYVQLFPVLTVTVKPLISTRSSSQSLTVREGEAFRLVITITKAQTQNNLKIKIMT